MRRARLNPPMNTRNAPCLRPWTATLIALAWLFGPSSAFAGPALGTEPPAGAIAWWRFDPTRFASAEVAASERRVILAGLRAGVAAGLFGAGSSSSVVSGLLAAGEVGSSPHTLCVLDFEATRDEDGTGMVVRDLRAVLELRSEGGHDEYLRTIRAIAVDGDREGAGTGRQRAVALPGDRRGVAFRRSAWPAWRTLTWCSGGGAFAVSLGSGSLRDWFAGEVDGEAERAAPAGAWVRHREAVEEARPDGVVFLEAYVSLDALRARFPSAFAYGRTPRMLDALGLRGASAAMLHGRFVEDAGGGPAMLALDLTVASAGVGERAGGLELRRFTEDRWPGAEATGVPRPGGSFVLASAVAWPDLVAWGRRVHEATVPDSELDEFLRERGAWDAAHGASLAGLLGDLRGWLVLSDDPPPPIPAPGLATVFVAAGDGVALAGLANGFDRVVSAFAEDVRRTELRGRPAWWLGAGSAGAVKLAAWAVSDGPAGPVVVGGWGPAAVTPHVPAVAEDPAAGGGP